MNWTSLKLISPVFVLLLVLAIAYFANQQTNNSVEGHKCSLVEGGCTLLFNNHQVAIKIGPTPISIEEELKVVFAYSKNLNLKESWVEGDNMFMGRMKVIIDQTINSENEIQSEGILFLGSCNLKSMSWILIAEFHELGVTKPIRLKFSFSTETE